jgi:hypothetical protein
VVHISVTANEDDIRRGPTEGNHFPLCCG